MRNRRIEPTLSGMDGAHYVRVVELRTKPRKPFWRTAMWMVGIWLVAMYGIGTSMNYTPAQQKENLRRAERQEMLFNRQAAADNKRAALLNAMGKQLKRRLEQDRLWHALPDDPNEAVREYSISPGNPSIVDCPMGDVDCVSGLVRNGR